MTQGVGVVSGIFIYWIFPTRLAPTYTIVVKFALIPNMHRIFFLTQVQKFISSL